jgi:hypothetical protein
VHCNIEYFTNNNKINLGGSKKKVAIIKSQKKKQIKFVLHLGVRKNSTLCASVPDLLLTFLKFFKSMCLDYKLLHFIYIAIIAFLVAS